MVWRPIGYHAPDGRIGDLILPLQAQVEEEIEEWVDQLTEEQLFTVMSTLELALVDETVNWRPRLIHYLTQEILYTDSVSDILEGTHTGLYAELHATGIRDTPRSLFVDNRTQVGYDYPSMRRVSIFPVQVSGPGELPPLPQPNFPAPQMTNMPASMSLPPTTGGGPPVPPVCMAATYPSRCLTTIYPTTHTNPLSTRIATTLTTTHTTTTVCWTTTGVTTPMPGYTGTLRKPTAIGGIADGQPFDHLTEQDFGVRFNEPLPSSTIIRPPPGRENSRFSGRAARLSETFAVSETEYRVNNTPYVYSNRPTMSSGMYPATTFAPAHSGFPAAAGFGGGPPSGNLTYSLPTQRTTGRQGEAPPGWWDSQGRYGTYPGGAVAGIPRDKNPRKTIREWKLNFEQGSEASAEDFLMRITEI